MGLPILSDSIVFTIDHNSGEMGRACLCNNSLELQLIKCWFGSERYFRVDRQIGSNYAEQKRLKAQTLFDSFCFFLASNRSNFRPREKPLTKN